MKVLYLASQTEESETLAIEREITDVQRQLSQSAVRSASIEFLPDVTIEALPIELSRVKPDFLHISVHGDREGLWFSRESSKGEGKQLVYLTAERLCAFLDPVESPKLVFLNACSSLDVASTLAEHGVAAIGTSAPITNQAAAAASRLLYERILGGRSIAEAFAAINALVSTIDDDRVTLRLCMPTGVNAASAVLHRTPRLAARLPSAATIKPGKTVPVQLGLIGCPADTVQVVFYTDDITFISDDEDGTFEDDLCEVVRDTPRRGEIWTDDWQTDGDFRAVASGLTAGGQSFSISGRIVEALETYASISSPSAEYLDLLANTTSVLRAYDGAGLAAWKPAKQKDANRAK